MPQKPHTAIHENVILEVRRKTEGRYATFECVNEHGLAAFEHTVLHFKCVDKTSFFSGSCSAILKTEVYLMEALLYCCCGLDVHRDVIEACILRGLEQTPKIIRRSFSTVPQGLSELVEWTEENGCYSIAMESTGVYWIPVFEAFERNSEYNEKLWVVNARHMRNLPGRKSDIKDAEWIATLLRHGLLEKSFVPSEYIRTLREFTRLRRSCIQERARYLNRLEKFLQDHGFKFSSVMSDIYCRAGQELLLLLRDNGQITEKDVQEKCRKLRHTGEEIHNAVCGILKPEEQCLLKHLLNKIDGSQNDIDSIDNDLRLLTAQIEDQITILSSIPGISTDSAVEIIAEISAAPQEYFESSEKLCSWAGLSPRNDESAGTIKSRKILHGNPHIKAIMCQVAWVSAYARNSSFHDWFWAHQGKLGRKKAIIAVSRKMLSLCYHLLKTQQLYSYPVTQN